MYDYTIDNLIKTNRYNSVVYPSKQKEELLASFSRMLDKNGFYHVLDAKTRSIHIYDDELKLKGDLIMGITSAFLAVQLPRINKKLADETYKLIKSYNKELEYGSIDYEEKNVFYVIQVEWRTPTSDKTIKEMLSHALDGFINDRETLYLFRNEVEDLRLAS